MITTEDVILVDQQDREIGYAEKLAAHQQNLLHRAFSIFIFHRDTKKLLLQQRALHKYHSPGLWTNTCCSHPRRDEDIVSAGKRRLMEELGFYTELQDIGWFHYNVHFANGLAENEIDHVLIGEIDDASKVMPNADEIHAIRWVELAELERELANSPTNFTAWLKLALKLIPRDHW